LQQFYQEIPMDEQVKDQAAEAPVAEAPAAAAAEAAPAVEPVKEVLHSTSVPEPANLLSQALKNVVLKIAENRKKAEQAGGSVVAEIGADVAAAVQELGMGLSQAGLLDDSVKSRPAGSAKALVVGAMEAVEVLAGELPA
jgi:hypothetical protein